VKWLADECFDNDIIRGCCAALPTLIVVRAQDVPEVAGRDDGTLLAWAGKNERVVLTHDVTTMAPARQAQAALAVIELVPDSLPTGQIIDDVLLLDQCSTESDWATRLISPAPPIGRGDK
jgi:hypothetical protein